LLVIVSLLAPGVHRDLFRLSSAASRANDVAELRRWRPQNCRAENNTIAKRADARRAARDDQSPVSHIAHGGVGQYIYLRNKQLDR
jgi:hypothetical protein